MRIAACLLSVTLLMAPPARAGNDDDARTAMRRGVAALARGDAEAALSQYEEAKRLAPGANAPYLYAAEALTRLERWPAVVENLEGYLAKNPDVSDAHEVRARIRKIRAEHFPGRVRVTTEPADATVFIDGMGRGHPSTFELPPGSHRFEARAASHESAAKDVMVVGDSDAEVAFVLLESVSPIKPGTLPVRDRTTPPPSSASPLRTLGWITAGVGAVTLLGSFILDVGALGPTIADYRSAAADHNLDARALYDDVQTFRVIVITGYVVGAALAVGGAALGLFAPSIRRTAVAPVFRF